MKSNPISIEILRSVLTYNQETGDLVWNARPIEKHKDMRGHHTFNPRHAGNQAFTSKTIDGYHQGSIFNQKYRAHQVAWALHYGEWPKNEIDHINGDKADNRIANLRSVTRLENSKNYPRSVANKSGVTGVHWYAQTKRWTAQITINRKVIGLGYFQDKDDAIAVRKRAEAENGFHPNHGRSQ